MVYRARGTCIEPPLVLFTTRGVLPLLQQFAGRHRSTDLATQLSGARPRRRIFGCFVVCSLEVLLANAWLTDYQFRRLGWALLCARAALWAAVKNFVKGLIHAASRSS